MITIHCSGGPVAGDMLRLPFDPKTFTRHAERKAFGYSNGHYVTRATDEPGVLIARWVELKPGLWHALGMRLARERLGRTHQPQIAWRGLGE